MLLKIYFSKLHFEVGQEVQWNHPALLVASLRFNFYTTIIVISCR